MTEPRNNSTERSERRPGQSKRWPSPAAAPQRGQSGVQARANDGRAQLLPHRELRAASRPEQTMAEPRNNSTEGSERRPGQSKRWPSPGTAQSGVQARANDGRAQEQLHRGVRASSRPEQTMAEPRNSSTEGSERRPGQSKRWPSPAAAPQRGQSAVQARANDGRAPLLPHREVRAASRPEQTMAEPRNSSERRPGQSKRWPSSAPDSGPVFAAQLCCRVTLQLFNVGTPVTVSVCGRGPEAGGGPSRSGGFPPRCSGGSAGNPARGLSPPLVSPDVEPDQPDAQPTSSAAPETTGETTGVCLQWSGSDKTLSRNAARGGGAPGRRCD
ncbi:uncharacterized protein V6R79_001199 [Siganus canaliculatus]